MSSQQDKQHRLFPFGNPFKMLLPKGPSLSPRLLPLLNKFELALAERLTNLKPKDAEDVLSLSWMRFAMEVLCQTHTDIKTIITELELPVCDWDEKWIDAYFDDSVKLLDICNTFSSEITRLNQGNLLLQCALNKMDVNNSDQLVKASSSLDGWRQHISSKNPRLWNCFPNLDSLIGTIHLPKVKNSDKGKVLMRAMYGVKVVTVFVSSIVVAAFSGSANKLVDIQVLETCLWADAFTDVQAYMNGESTNTLSSRQFAVLKELESVDTSVKKLLTMIQEGVVPIEAEAVQNSASDLGKKAAELSQGLDVLAKRVDGLFQIQLSGRNVLLCNLRMVVSAPDMKQGTGTRQGQAVKS